MGHMLSPGAVSLFASSVQLLQGQLQKSDTHHATTLAALGAARKKIHCAQTQADMKQPNHANPYPS